MRSNSPLLIGLTGVARLAGVQRPVASMWRSRFANADDPFPAPTKQQDGRPLFDAIDVARWLERTDHGNNPEAVADAAASAAPAGFDIADPDNIAIVDALLTLRAATGSIIGGSHFADIRTSAAQVDPDDLCLRSEIENAVLEWADWADALADAAYSPIAAAHVIERRHDATRSAAGSAGPLTGVATELLVSLASALVSDETTALLLGDGSDPALASSLLGAMVEATDLSVADSTSARSIRRRLLCEGIPAIAPETHGTKLHLWRLPSSTTIDTAAILRELNELTLTMDHDERGVILAPSTAVTEGVTGEDDRVRSDALRSGRVRAIVKLPSGLVTTAPRETLALWVLGAPVGNVPIADRFTAVADLTDTKLTPAARADLTSDIVAAMGSARAVRAHAFRFVRLARTTSLLATRGSLVAGTTRPARSTTASPQDLPALLDRAREALGNDEPAESPVAAQTAPVPPGRVEELIAGGHLRVLAGTRIHPTEFTSHGLVAVTTEDLDEPAQIGARRVDPLEFAAKHPSARLTAPGDVIFHTSPTPRAWIDTEGSSVAVYPARVLRITAADPGGLIPELIVADMKNARGGAGAWRRWMLRRVAPAQIAPLRAALADLATRRGELERRLDAIDTYSDLLTAAVVSGTVTLTDNAVNAAPDTQ